MFPSKQINTKTHTGCKSFGFEGLIELDPELHLDVSEVDGSFIVIPQGGRLSLEV